MNRVEGKNSFDVIFLLLIPINIYINISSQWCYFYANILGGFGGGVGLGFGGGSGGGGKL